MSFKKCKVVMLPANEKANGENIIVLHKGFLGLSIGNNILNSQNLYITLDEEIKEGDYYYNVLLNVVYKASLGFIKSKCNNPKSEFKVIASTDKSLRLYSEPIINGVATFQGLIPQPSQQFIEKYIEEYNKGNIITDILVGYSYKGEQYNEENTLNINHPKINSKDNTITIKKVKDSWTRDEVISLIKEYRNCIIGVSTSEIAYTNKWIEQNL